jgi:hypothetical protein
VGVDWFSQWLLYRYKKSTTRSSSTPIQQMIRRHGETFREMDRLYALNGDDAFDSPEYVAVADEAMDLESRIVNTLTKVQPTSPPSDASSAMWDSLTTMDTWAG